MCLFTISQAVTECNIFYSNECKMCVSLSFYLWEIQSCVFYCAKDEGFVFVITPFPIDPPFIKVAKSSEPQVGRPGTLECDATAVPKPEFDWYRDDKRYKIVDDTPSKYR